MFNIHSVRISKYCKLRTQSSQTTTKCEYKVNTGSDDNLMPIKVFKVPFLDITIGIEKKVVLCTYNSSYIPQMDISMETIINKSINFQYNIFVVPGMGEHG